MGTTMQTHGQTQKGVVNLDTSVDKECLKFRHAKPRLDFVGRETIDKIKNAFVSLFLLWVNSLGGNHCDCCGGVASNDDEWEKRRKARRVNLKIKLSTSQRRILRTSSQLTPPSPPPLAVSQCRRRFQPQEVVRKTRRYQEIHSSLAL